jgi:hypothetical protein
MNLKTLHLTQRRTGAVVSRENGIGCVFYLLCDLWPSVIPDFMKASYY